MRYAGFIGPSYTLDSPNIDSQRSVNWYPKMSESGNSKEREVLSLIGTPGYSLLVNLGTGPIRGEHKAKNGTLYSVCGNKLYRVSSAWVKTEIGTLQTSTGHVDFADNGVTLCVVDGPNGYYHTLNSSSTTQIDDEDFVGATRVEYIDGYFLFIEPSSQTFYISELNGTGIDGLDFSEADGSPDNLVSVLVNHRQVWLFGEDSIEGWYNSGNADFPFERIGGGFIEIGCAAAFSVAKLGTYTLWLGKNADGHGIVYAAQGFAAQRISTHAVEKAIQGYGDISDAVAWTYQENGHDFYVLNFTAANTTWVYDLSTRLWHERAAFSAGQYQRHRANYHAFAYGTHVIGDYENGNLYKLDSSVYTDAGSVIRRMRAAPHLSEGGKNIIYHEFRLDMETGVGLDGSGQGSDPQIILQWSDDGGHTWSNEKWRSIGKIGKRNTKVIWRNLGMSTDRVYRVIMTDPVKANLMGADFEAERLAS